MRSHEKDPSHAVSPPACAFGKCSSMVEYGQTRAEIFIANQVHALKTHGAMKIVFRTFLEGF